MTEKVPLTITVDAPLKELIQWLQKERGHKQNVVVENAIVTYMHVIWPLLLSEYAVAYPDKAEALQQSMNKITPRIREMHPQK